MGGAGNSTLLMEEYFDGEDSRFVEHLRDVRSPEALAGLAERWKNDPRPWAREQVFRYLLDGPLDRICHHVVVKRLFKQAEENEDDGLMAAFLVAFDRLVRRIRKKRYHWDWEAGQSWMEERLASPRNVILPPRWGGGPVPDGRLFSYHTRYYLRRRAWRYFRQLGFRRPADYPRAVATALALYGEEDVAAGENILDCWGLVHACFHRHAALRFGASRIDLAEGHSLSELTPAPRFAELWREPSAAKVLLDLVAGAPSRLVRVWAMELLRRDHLAHVADLGLEPLRPLLDSESEEVEQFAAELVAHAKGVEKLPVGGWLDLLDAKSPLALQAICDLMRRHVDAARVEFPTRSVLACRAETPVAQLGFDLLAGHTPSTDEELAWVGSLADARCAALGEEIARWALSHLATPERYATDSVIAFFDSRVAEVRTGAWSWLLSDLTGRNDAQLWARLSETPFDDLRLRLVDELGRRVQRPAVGLNRLAPVWCSVLLGVHRGGRQKAKAVRQIADAIRDEPAAAGSLLPILALAARSLRGPETRAGLAAIVGLLEDRPELGPQVAATLPELEVVS